MDKVKGFALQNAKILPQYVNTCGNFIEWKQDWWWTTRETVCSAKLALSCCEKLRPKSNRHGIQVIKLCLEFQWSWIVHSIDEVDKNSNRESTSHFVAKLCILIHAEIAETNVCVFVVISDVIELGFQTWCTSIWSTVHRLHHYTHANSFLNCIYWY